VKRDALMREIQQLDSRLDSRQAALARRRFNLRSRLRAVSPAWWVGGGLVLGLFTGWLSGRTGLAGPGLTYLRSGFRVLSLVRLGLAAGAGEL
jgi:fatty acid desaturase